MKIKRTAKKREIAKFLEGFSCPSCLTSETNCSDCLPLKKVDGYSYGHTLFEGDSHDRP